MAIIQYRDSDGNIRNLSVIKGDRGPIGPRGYVGPKGEKGEKGGTLIKGSRPTKEDLIQDQIYLNPEIGDGYLIEEDNILMIWDGEKWIENDNFIPVKLDDLVDVEISDVELDNSTILAYDTVYKRWMNKQIDVDPGFLATSEDIIVTNPDGIGIYNPGDIIPNGTNFNQFVKNITHKAIPPEYKYPKLEIDCDIEDVELGSMISPTINIKYTKNDAGAFRTCRIYKNSSLLEMYRTEITSFQIPSYIIDNDTTIRVEVEFEAGEVKNDSDGNPYPNGKIEYGYISMEISIRAINSYYYYSTSNESVPTIDDIIIGNKGYDITTSKSIEINSDDDTKSIVFAYPKSLGECSEIDYVGFDKHNKDVFNVIQLDIPVPSGAAVVTYYVYYYTAPIEIGPATFVLTI